MKLKVNIELLLFLVFIIHYSIAEPVSNEDVIAKVHKYLGDFKNLVKTLRRTINRETDVGYVVQTIDDPSIFVRGLVAISQPVGKINGPGTSATYTFNIQSAIASKVYQNVTTVFGVLQYDLEVPFVQANGQKVYYVAGVPSAGISADRGTIDTTLALSALMGYIQSFYYLFKGHKRNVFAYWVWSNATQTYIRALTNTPDANGHYAIGSSLTNTAIIQALANGNTFTGNVTLFGKNYNTMYKPFNMFNTKIVIGSGILQS